MKLKSAVLLSSVLVTSAAFAQEAAPKAVESTKIVKEVTPYGLLQSYTNLMDSQRSNTPDFGQIITQFGLKLSEGAAKGDIQLRLAGNSGDAADGKVLVRRANLGLDLPGGTSIRLGRSRFGNPTTYGADATTTLEGFGPTDGLMLSQNINISEGNTVVLKAIVGNAASVIAPKVAASNYKYGENTASDSKFIAVGFDAKISGVDAGVYYGTDSKAKLQGAAPLVVADAAKGIKEATAKSDAYGTFSHLEASLGYGFEGIAFGVNYQQFNWGALKSVSKSEGGKVTTGDKIPGTDKVTLNQLTAGVNGDSTLFGGTDFMQTGDKFIYAASWGMTSTRNAALAGQDKTNEKDADVSQIVLAGGYNIAGLTFELNLVNESTKGKNFNDTKGDQTPAADKKTSANKIYISSVYDF